MASTMRKPSAYTRRPTQDRPSLNLYDIPEMMAGARPSANSVERDRFNQRCRKLWEEGDEYASQACQNSQHGNTAERYSQLEKMFPELDPELIWGMCQETTNVQQIVDTLLALSVSMASNAGNAASNEAAVGSSSACESPECIKSRMPLETVPQSDGGAWPTLLDGDGWEIVNYQALQQQEQDLGTAWCKTAQDAAHLPAPRPSHCIAVHAKHHQKESPRTNDADDGIEEDYFPTDYELRHMRGQMRATKLATKCPDRHGNRLCNHALQESDLTSESGDSIDTVSDLYQ
eukprot:gnl/MRDRNA2_/MRDRNA2_28797_c0_seq1.p1 gnl/MRDRNA2_/MRDRNA2_28797_c0~~gnl/MRDRNA2_/MRDRNA2_28797_c0_seq1.p1  ORF type:complete len:289 (+),score=57.35 gnl/MRDRNA2_/MRDRNA2_28797_c0_seq1:100-966(+)